MIIYLVLELVLIVVMGIFFFHRAAPRGFHFTGYKLLHGGIAGFVTLSIFIAAGLTMFAWATRRPDMKIILAQADDLISRAGGSREICDETARLVKTVDRSVLEKTLSTTDVAAYPALANLLRAASRHPARLFPYGPPPVIVLSVGGHIDGYTIVIAAPATSEYRGEWPPSNAVNIANSCIFIER